MRFFLMFLVFWNCANPDDDFYSTQDGVSRVLLAITLKNTECGYYRTLITMVPGRTRKKKLDLCVYELTTVACTKWSLENPLPLSCTLIEFRF